METASRCSLPARHASRHASGEEKTVIALLAQHLAAAGSVSATAASRTPNPDCSSWR
jgi:hypothetical protein